MNTQKNQPGFIRRSIHYCQCLLGLALLISALPVDAAAPKSKFTYTVSDAGYDWQQYPAALDQGFVIPFAVELNGDGATDFILTGATIASQFPASRGPQPGLILFNNGDNTFTPAAGDVPGSETARQAVIADFNGDEILDIYIADVGFDAQPFPGFKNQLLLGTGTGFTDVSDRLPDVEAFTHGAAAADINNDGYIDIISLNSDALPEKFSYFLINDGDANFTMDQQRLPDSLKKQESLVASFSAELADLDGDGFVELIIGGSGSDPAFPLTRIHWNDGSGFFTDEQVSFLADADPWGIGSDKIVVDEIKAVDVNGDNLNDLLLHSTNQGTFTGISMQLFINHGSRQMVDESDARLGELAQDADPARSHPAFTQFVDMNNDGITDIFTFVSSDSTDKGIPFFEGLGGGFFVPITMKSLTDSINARDIMGRQPVISQGGVGFIAVGVTPLSEFEDAISLSYVSLTEHPEFVFADQFENLISDCGPPHQIFLGANLRDCDLSGLNLSDAVLAGADLSGANLTGTNLTAANLTGANLAAANLSNANLIGAFITDIKADAIIWSNTTCPDGSNSNDNAGTCLANTINNPPVIASVKLSPVTAFEDTELTCAAIAEDVDGDLLTISYEWLNNGVTLAGIIASTLNGSDFDRTNVIRCVVTADDGNGGTDIAFSNSVTIANTPAVILSVVVSPKPAQANTPLTCTPDVFDADGDATTLSFKWRVNFGEPVSTDQILSDIHFVSNDIVECQANVSDGISESDPAFDQVTID